MRTRPTSEPRASLLTPYSPSAPLAPTGLSPLQTSALALVMGAAGGAACTAIRLGFRGLQWCFTGQSGMPPDAAASLSLSWRILIPIAGGLLGWLVLWMYRHSGREQHPVDYVEAVRLTGGDIPFMATAVRTLSSAFSVATGAAIGREGSMIQFATAICSQIGNLRTGNLTIGKSQISQSASGQASSAKRLPFRSTFAALTGNAGPLDGSMRSRAVAFGVAAGVAAAYQAPIAGAFFASEIAIGATRPRELPPLLLASVTGWLVSRPLLGPGPLFPAPASVGSPTLQWLWLVVAAVALGLLAPVYQWLIRQSLRIAQRLPISFAWAGAVVGVLSLATPLVWGNGDRALFTLTHVPSQLSQVGTNDASPGILWLAGILAARLLATCFCVGAGVAGGVFTPTVFAGAAAGLLIALLLHVHLPLLFVLAGISSLLAAVTHAPLMTSCMTAELTGKWALFPLFYLTSWIAWQTAARLSGRSLYAIATSTPGEAANDRRT